MARKTTKNNNGKVIGSQASMDKAVKSICDILRRDKAKGARLYVPELTWMFFLRYLDLMEQREEQQAVALGTSFQSSIAAPYRWCDWAAPFDNKIPLAKAISGKLPGWKRQELSEQAIGSYLGFVNDVLFPYLKNLGEQPGATNKQKVISEIIRNKERTILASETNLKMPWTGYMLWPKPRLAISICSRYPRLLKVFCPAWAKSRTTAASFSHHVRLFALS